MLIRPAPLAGARAPIPSLRVIVALLAVLQLGAPVAALATDEAPASSHVDHVGAPDDGCPALHDEHFCLSCRVLTAAPMDARPALALPAQPASLVLAPADRAGDPATDPTANHPARAPPRT